MSSPHTPRGSERRPSPEVPIVISKAEVGTILTLRHTVLRPGLPFAMASFEGDSDVDTIHLAARAASRVVGCATFMKNHIDGEPAYQLRGMATDPAWRARGVGRRLLEHGEDILRNDPIRLRWCNARVSAIGFYQSCGWTVVSDVFDIPDAGPHRRMTKRV